MRVAISCSASGTLLTYEKGYDTFQRRYELPYEKAIPIFVSELKSYLGVDDLPEEVAEKLKLN